MCLALAAVATLGACKVNPGPHPRALENTELCARYYAAGDLDRAEIHCDLGLQFSPEFSDLHANKGLIYMKRGQKDKAKASFIKALRYNQEQAQAYNNLGVIYFDDGKFGEAHDNFQRALKVNPDFLEARYNLARAYHRMKKPEQSRKEYNTILAIDPNIADAYNDLCILSHEANDLQQALGECTRAVQLVPNFIGALVNLGAVQNELGRFCEATETYAACIERDPNSIECRNSLPVTRRKCELARPELKDIEDRQRMGAQTPPGLLLLARTYREKGLRAEEERTYKKCVKLDGRYAPCHYGLFEIFREEGRRNEATIACKNFLKFAAVEEFPREVESCELALKSNAH